MKPNLNSFEIWPERYIITLASILLFLTILGFSGWVFYLRSVTALPTEGMIDVVSATFGGNCEGAENNLRPWIRSACGGKKQCNFLFDDRLLGYPTANCKRQVRIDWRCSRSGPTFRVDDSSNPDHGTKVQLTCN